LLLASFPAQAHKLNVFSWANDRQIYGEAFFHGGRKAKNITVRIQDAKSHNLLLSTQTNEQGEFAFTVPQQAAQQRLDLLITADSGDGHRGEWLLEATEYLEHKSSSSNLAPESATGCSTTALIDTEAIREIVRQELKREMLPIKQELAERQEKKIRPQDILGGIGCIIGLAALFTWFQANKKKKISADR
jgi:nickel transport protein